MVERTYYDDGAPAWEWWRRAEITLPEDRSGIHIRHGYTADDIDHLARAAVLRCRGHYLPPGDLYMLAYEGVTLALMEAADPPDGADLIAAAQRGVLSESEAVRHHHGIDPLDGADTAPRYGMYWRHVAGPAAAAEERIVERIALGQVWPRFTGAEREALAALAAAGTRDAAASMLGLTRHTLNQRLRMARARAFGLWYEHEIPPPVPRDRRVRSYAESPVTHCPHGHEYTEANTRVQRKRDGRECRACRTCQQLQGRPSRRSRRQVRALDHQSNSPRGEKGAAA